MGYELDFGVVFSGAYLGFFLEGIRNTLTMFAAAWILGLVLAFLLTLLRASGFKPLEMAVAAYVAYHRNVPLLVQLLVWYFGAASVLPRSVNIFMNRHNAEMLFAILALSLYAAAYMSEDLRSALRAIPKTQMEAGRSMGFNYAQTMRWVIIPQTWRIALPPMIGQTLLLFKGTSLAAAIGVGELTYQARQIETQSFRVFEAFAAVTVIYLIGSFALMFLGAYVAKNYRLRTV
ncbi:MAG: amino acid ABC transporter permease [Phyllobacterium sp.]